MHDYSDYHTIESTLNSLCQSWLLYQLLLIPANVSICSSHKWESIFNPRIQSEPETNESPVTVCTLCNSCAERSLSCDYNGLQGDTYRQCLCHTRHQCCWDCGICKHCARALWVRTKLTLTESSMELSMDLHVWLCLEPWNFP